MECNERHDCVRLLKIHSLRNLKLELFDEEKTIKDAYGFDDLETKASELEAEYLSSIVAPVYECIIRATSPINILITGYSGKRISEVCHCQGV
jgi:hypothetical protein